MKYRGTLFLVVTNLVAALLGAAFPLSIEAPQNILLYSVTHGNWMHLGVNMLGLFVFGRMLERDHGARWLLLVYCGCVYAGGAMQLIVTPQHAVIGASAGIFGLIAICGLLYPKRRMLFFGVLPVQMGHMAGVLITLEVLLQVFNATHGHIAHAAHIGGAMCGFGVIFARWIPQWLAK
jgi:membrane associated rhomboid family serine protease